jgi:hypothetical protein
MAQSDQDIVCPRVEEPNLYIVTESLAARFHFTIFLSPLIGVTSSTSATATQPKI